MLTIWEQVSPLLVNAPIPTARNCSSGKSRKFVSDHPHTIDPEVAPQVNRRRTISLSQGTPPQRLHRIPVDGAGNPPLRQILSHLLHPTTMIDGVEKILQRKLSHPPKSYQKILMLGWNHATPTASSCHTMIDTGTTLHAGTSSSCENHV
jgi:hypothetical protein